ncbi:O-antigen ligase family protein [Pedobacter glucosidilyticus]|uniref:O-antigen ligase family protein n=1 Tax=Pedobacter glucosidilyticus TaxID=1122941 RepID=UPI000419C438|nr:O-antigen ligase family protein [Pedobacter glucosidilyticus]
MKQAFLQSDTGKAVVISIGALLLSFLVGLLTIQFGIITFFASTIGTAALIFIIATIKDPRIGFLFYLVYCFLLSGIMKNFPFLPLGPSMEMILGLTWVSIFINANKFKWSNLNNDYCLLVLIWFIINILEVLNPAGASLLGWLNEIRFTALNWLMVAPLAFIIFNSKKDLNTFFKVTIGASVFAALYGVKQLYIGVSSEEQRWLNEGADFTHIVFGELRVFSLFTDAGQFGASQAHMALVTLVLALGPFKLWKKVLLGIAASILIYGMLISGTRGALFALVSGAFFAIFLTKNFKVLIIGTICSLMFFSFLKYSTYGNQYYEIRRLRTALDPQDASLNARLMNQAKLKEALKNLPFGGGVGITGVNGDKYNSDKYLSSIPPDSYWVKIWVMYGVVGLVIWFSFIMYLLGKSCGLVWNIEDKKLKTKAIALTSGVAGLFFCSYGNEVMNGLPSSIIMYMSWAYVFLIPKFDNPELKDDEYV